MSFGLSQGVATLSGGKGVMRMGSVEWKILEFDRELVRIRGEHPDILIRRSAGERRDEKTSKEVVGRLN